MSFFLSLAVVALAAVWLGLRGRARFAHVPPEPRGKESRPSGTVETVFFAAKDGTRLEGWLFLPHRAGGEPPPIVVMAPGLAGTKEGFLEPFAWAFVEAGLAALVFDYRCFGGSDGLPRHWVDPARHREDYEAAIAFVQGPLAGEGRVRADSLALWGSSFSGGTALVTAAGNPAVKALIAQCPYLETPPALEPKGLAMARFVLWATLDLSRIFPPIYVPLFGRPGEWVFAPSRENPSVWDFHGPLGSEFWQKLPWPHRGGWENRMLARALGTLDQFVPMEHVARLSCPTLLVAARDDDMIPLPYVERARSLVTAEVRDLRVFDGGHFDLYVGPHAAENARHQAEFLAAHLGSLSHARESTRSNPAG